MIPVRPFFDQKLNLEEDFIKLDNYILFYLNRNPLFSSTFSHNEKKISFKNLILEQYTDFKFLLHSNNNQRYRINNPLNFYSGFAKLVTELNSLYNGLYNRLRNHPYTHDDWEVILKKNFWFPEYIPKLDEKEENERLRNQERFSYIWEDPISKIKTFQSVYIGGWLFEYLHNIKFPVTWENLTPIIVVYIRVCILKLFLRCFISNTPLQATLLFYSSTCLRCSKPALNYSITHPL